MTKMVPTRSFSGIVVARADVSDPNAALAEINKAFSEFKASNDENLKKRDVVTDEKLDKINASMTDLEAKLKEIAASAAATAVGATGGDSKERKAYAEAFDKWFRKGDRAVADADLGQMAVQANLSSDSAPDGGYVVTPEMDSQIDRVLGTESVMRSLARVISIGTDEYKKLINQGGAGSGWVGERESRPGTDSPTLSEIVINAHEIYAKPAATQKLLDDANVDIAGWLAEEVSIEFAEQEGDAWVNGNGVKKPRGILAYPTVANASYAWGKVGFTVTGAAATFASSDPAAALIALYYSLKRGYRNGATWLTSDAVMETIRKFKDGQGNYLWAPPTGVDMPATILGKPVETDDNMPALGANAFPVAFGNFNRAYLIVDRIGTRVLRDPYTNKPYVMFYTTKRTGGGIQNFEALKLLKCST
jgi:HK97 family phage major capsid protein